MNGSLYLFPATPEAAPDPAPVLAVLEALQVVGTPLAETADKRVFRAGEGFAREVIFAGCSPHLRFEATHADDRDFCHLALHGPLPTPRLFTGPRTGRPRCLSCRARLDDWRERAVAPLSALPCSACAAACRAIDIDWRQQAAIGRLLVELRNVFPGEATPSDRLLAALHKAVGTDWRYGWAAMSEAP